MLDEPFNQTAYAVQKLFSMILSSSPISSLVGQYPQVRNNSGVQSGVAVPQVKIVSAK